MPRRRSTATDRLRGTRILAAAAAAFALAFAGCGSGAGVAARAAPPPAPGTLTVSSGGITRSYLLYVPAAQRSRRRPLVLVYHGALDTAQNTVNETNFEQVAGRRGLIVAFLQGYAGTWNEGAGHTPARVAGVDDVAFTKAVLHQIEAAHAIDPARIAAVGFSNGALLMHLLGCRLATDLTAIVPVEGEFPASVSPGCAPARPISVFEIHGTADASIPYGGGPFPGVGGGTTVLSAPASAARWAALDGCSTAPRSVTWGPSVLAVYPRCRAGVDVTLDTITAGTHTWPADIGQLVANFLGAHPARRPAARA